MFLGHVIFVLAVIGQANSYSQNDPDAGKPLIMLAAPLSDDPYYKEVHDDVVKWMASYAKLVEGKDNILISADPKSKALLLAEGIKKDMIIEAYVDDIWMRDFTTHRMTSPAVFKYRPKHQPAADAKRVQKSFQMMIKNVTGKPLSSWVITEAADIVNDGGNFVDNEEDAAVLTSRIFYDNPDYTEADLKAFLSDATGYSDIVIISELEGDTTGHSDGMVSYLGPKTLLLGELGAAQQAIVKDELEYDLEGISDVTVITNRYKPTLWKGFTSACGTHLNMVVTDDYIYLPVFGDFQENVDNGYTKDLDNKVVGEIKAALKKAGLKKTVITVKVPQLVCRMGGSVRCLSWQIKDPLADALVKKARELSDKN